MIFVFCFLMNCLIKTSSDCYYSFYLLITFMHFPSFSFFSFVWHFYYFFILILFFPLFISCFLSLNLLIKKLKNYKKLNFVFFIFLQLSFASFSLTLFRMHFFGDAHGWGQGAKRPPLHKICHTYHTVMKLASHTLPKEDPKNI